MKIISWIIIILGMACVIGSIILLSNRDTYIYETNKPRYAIAIPLFIIGFLLGTFGMAMMDLEREEALIRSIRASS